MAETLFVSDLHLDEDRPQIIRGFRHFLEDRAPEAEALYILGDLFEYWIGDDDPASPFEPVMASLRDLGQRIPVYFLAGNRDFLAGSGFAERSGCQLLDEPVALDLYGTPTLLMHGDTLCTDDRDYLALRARLRDPGWQERFLARPLSERRQEARALRAESHRAQVAKATAITDVNPEAVAATFRQHGVDRLIHGHTHRPAIHRGDVDGRPVERVVLGDWYTQGSLLECTPAGCRLTPWGCR